LKILAKKQLAEHKQMIKYCTAS